MTTLLTAILFTAIPTIDSFFQTELKDVTFSGRVERSDQAELRKINRDFGTSYRFQSTTVRLKEPFKLRIDAVVDDATVRYVINDTTEVIKTAGFHVKQDLSKAPGRRQTLFDFGVLTPSLFTDLYDAKFVRMDRTSGDAVFDVFYKPGLKDFTRSRIWLDKTKHVIDKREWYNQEGGQRATFYYSHPVQESGIWMPTRIEVRNVDDAVAGVTNYDSLKVNTGLSDDLFSTK